VVPVDQLPFIDPEFVPTVNEIIVHLENDDDVALERFDRNSFEYRLSQAHVVFASEYLESVIHGEEPIDDNYHQWNFLSDLVRAVSDFEDTQTRFDVYVAQIFVPTLISSVSRILESQYIPEPNQYDRSILYDTDGYVENISSILSTAFVMGVADQVIAGLIVLDSRLLLPLANIVTTFESCINDMYSTIPVSLSEYSTDLRFYNYLRSRIHHATLDEFNTQTINLILYLKNLPYTESAIGTGNFEYDLIQCIPEHYDFSRQPLPRRPIQFETAIGYGYPSVDDDPRYRREIAAYYIGYFGYNTAHLATTPLRPDSHLFDEIVCLAPILETFTLLREDENRVVKKLIGRKLVQTLVDISRTDNPDFRKNFMEVIVMLFTIDEVQNITEFPGLKGSIQNIIDYFFGHGLAIDMNIVISILSSKESIVKMIQDTVIAYTDRTGNGLTSDIEMIYLREGARHLPMLIGTRVTESHLVDFISAIDRLISTDINPDRGYDPQISRDLYQHLKNILEIRVPDVGNGVSRYTNSCDLSHYLECPTVNGEYFYGHITHPQSLAVTNQIYTRLSIFSSTVFHLNTPILDRSRYENLLNSSQFSALQKAWNILGILEYIDYCSSENSATRDIVRVWIIQPDMFGVEPSAGSRYSELCGYIELSLNSGDYMKAGNCTYVSIQKLIDCRPHFQAELREILNGFQSDTSLVPVYVPGIFEAIIRDRLFNDQGVITPRYTRGDNFAYQKTVQDTILLELESYVSGNHEAVRSEVVANQIQQFTVVNQSNLIWRFVSSTMNDMYFTGLLNAVDQLQHTLRSWSIDNSPNRVQNSIDKYSVYSRSILPNTLATCVVDYLAAEDSEKPLVFLALAFTIFDCGFDTVEAVKNTLNTYQLAQLIDSIPSLPKQLAVLGGDENSPLSRYFTVLSSDRVISTLAELGIPNTECDYGQFISYLTLAFSEVESRERIKY
jgi:hypothetical protein